VPQDFACRACAALSLVKRRESQIVSNLTSQNFAITDSNYGVTGAIYKCPGCGLLQCPEIGNVLPFYQALRDTEYATSRPERCAQAADIVKCVLNVAEGSGRNRPRLLDIGAGSGVLVEAATHAGLEATGIEPSTWLVNIGRQRGLKIIEGTFPHVEAGAGYDVVTLIDVIEHVVDPLELLLSSREVLRPGGKCVVVTPDVSSLVARVLGFKWWHYRIAHISYFDRRNLTLLLARAGFRVCGASRPGWYFSYAYLRQRLAHYLPLWVIPPAVGPLRNLVLPLNLRDSLLLVCERVEAPPVSETVC
jgi:SAM-dependent methyltransferase